MAVITSHTLNGSDGSHAGGIVVSLRNTQTGAELFHGVMDDGGRLRTDVPKDQIDASVLYELVFETAPYWAQRGHTGADTVPEIALRFYMADPNGSYHMPVIINPHSYSTWKSG